MDSHGRGSFDGSRTFRPKPVEMNKEYDVSIMEESRRGDGIAKIEGFVILVPGAKVGQNLKIKIVQIGKKHANGQIIESTENEETSK